MLIIFSEYCNPAPLVLESDTQRRRCLQNFEGILEAVKLVACYMLPQTTLRYRNGFWNIPVIRYN